MACALATQLSRKAPGSPGYEIGGRAGDVGTNLETEADVKLSLTGLWFRINDKIQRLKQLVVLGEPDTVAESLIDTY